MSSKSKKRQRVVLMDDMSPPPEAIACSVDESQDAPTIRLVSTENDDGENFFSSSFSQLGSVLGKLESFNAASRKVKTLSTVPSETSLLPLVPVNVIDSEKKFRFDLKNLNGIVKKILIESSWKGFESKYNPIFDNFNFYTYSGRPLQYGSSIFFDAYSSFVTNLCENSTGWGIMRIPLFFNNFCILLCTRSTLYISGFPSGVFTKKLAELGIPFEDHTQKDEEENDESMIICGRANIFATFDALRSFELTSRKDFSLISSFPFVHSVLNHPKIVVKSAAAFPGYIVQIDNIFCPLESIETAIPASAGFKATITTDKTSFLAWNPNEQEHNDAADDGIINLLVQRCSS